MAKILLCDDDKDQALYSGGALLKVGHQSKWVETPEEALRELQTSRYDCVFMDLQNLNLRNRYSGDAYDYPAKLKDLQEGVVVIGYSVLPSEFLDEAKGHFDDICNKMDVFMDIEDAEFESLKEFLEKHGIS